MSRAQLDDLGRRIAGAMDHHGIDPETRVFREASRSALEVAKVLRKVAATLPRPRRRPIVWRGFLVFIPIWLLLVIHTVFGWIAEAAGNLFDSLLDWAGYEL